MGSTPEQHRWSRNLSRIQAFERRKRGEPTPPTTPRAYWFPPTEPTREDELKDQWKLHNELLRKQRLAYESKMEGMAETSRAQLSPPSSVIEHVMYGGGQASGSKGTQRYDIASDAGSRGRRPTHKANSERGIPPLLRLMLNHGNTYGV